MTNKTAQFCVFGSTSKNACSLKRRTISDAKLVFLIAVPTDHGVSIEGSRESMTLREAINLGGDVTVPNIFGFSE